MAWKGEGLSIVICLPAHWRIRPPYFSMVRAMPATVLSEGLANMNLSRREAGLWLRENSPVDSLIMSRDPEVPFYADRPWVASPNEEFSLFWTYVRKRGADYLVVDEREATVIRPQLAFLMDDEPTPKGLVRVYTADDPRGKTAVFRVEY